MQPIAGDPASAPRHPRTVVGAVLAFLGAIAFAIGVTASPAAGLAATQSLPLHNDRAGVENDCPDGVREYWHFIIAPNNGTYSIVTITLDLDGTNVTFDGASIIPNGTQTDNVFVAVPSGFTLDDLSKANSVAEVSPVGGSPKFVLSHLCDGNRTTTTTSTTSTSTTVADTTTIPETTSTTVAATTTSTPTTSTTSTSTTSTSTSTTSTSTSTSTTVADTTTTVADTTTTVADTTTTIPDTAATTTTVAGTTTIPDTTTTTVADTTTTVAIAPPTTPTTTTLPCEWDPDLEPDDPNCYQGTTTSVQIAPPTTTIAGGGSPTTTVTELPRTGAGSGNMMILIGALLILIGGVMVLSTRQDLEIV